mmetsp:Transcript_6994/g.15088  ORF Transcript_6994/g.15088 Transcript_6994/m.15088 type:complete len:134 (+) Transcript_6994:138-539(+)
MPTMTLSPDGAIAPLPDAKMASSKGGSASHTGPSAAYADSPGARNTRRTPDFAANMAPPVSGANMKVVAMSQSVEGCANHTGRGRKYVRIKIARRLQSTGVFVISTTQVIKLIKMRSWIKFLKLKIKLKPKAH